MKRLNMLRRHSAVTFAFIALMIANVASTRYSIIYYQSEVPKSLKS